MTKAKVMHIVPTFEDCSITRIALHIIQHLGHEDYEWLVTSAGPNGMMEQIYQDCGVKTYQLPGPSHLRRGVQLKKILDSNPVDLLHTHTPKTTVITWMATVLSHRHIVHLLTKHLDGSNYRKFEWIYTLVGMISLYQTDYIVPVSKTMAERLLRYPGINSDRLSAIQNGVDCDYFYQPQERDACRAELNLSEEHIVFFFSGRLEPMKNLSSLIKCFATVHSLYPASRLVIAGTGSLEAELKAQAQELGIAEDVIWCGWRTDVPRLLAASDIYVQPSLNEGLSLSIIEAMCAEKPIIATKVGGIYEVLERDVSGILIEPGDNEQLTQAITTLVSQPEKRKQMGQVAKQNAVQNFGLRRMTAQYQSIYDDLLGRKS